MTVQMIVTPAGERLVVLSEADYRDLVEAAEDAVDVAGVEVFERRLASGEEEMIPSEIVDRMLNGENRVRVWRDHRGLTSALLAEQAGVAPGELAEIESGQAEGSLATLRKIAAAMHLSIDDLVA